MDSYNWTVTDEHMLTYPAPYSIEYYGYKPGVVALSFDDGPDPKWTPKILDALKAEGSKGTFFMIGEQAQDNVSVMQRVLAGGPRDRQSHLDPSGHQRDLSRTGADCSST